MLKCLNIYWIMKFYHEKIFLKNNPLLEIYQQNISPKAGICEDYLKTSLLNCF